MKFSDLMARLAQAPPFSLYWWIALAVVMVSFFIGWILSFYF